MVPTGPAKILIQACTLVTLLKLFNVDLKQHYVNQLWKFKRNDNRSFSAAGQARLDTAGYRKGSTVELES